MFKDFWNDFKEALFNNRLAFIVLTWFFPDEWEIAKAIASNHKN